MCRSRAEKNHVVFVHLKIPPGVPFSLGCRLQKIHGILLFEGATSSRNIAKIFLLSGRNCSGRRRDSSTALPLFPAPSGYKNRN